MRIRSHPRDAHCAFGALGIEPRLWPGDRLTDRPPHHRCKGMAGDLCLRLRSRQVLHRAWAAVRSSGLASPSTETNRSIRKFDESWVPNLERISSKLREGKFKFDGEKGGPISKGKEKAGYRPLVL